MRGILYGVGAGPGDPELLTFKAVNILKKCHAVALPDTGGTNTVLNIVGDYMGSKPLIFCPAPMTKDPKVLLAAQKESFAKISEKLETGLDVAFVTLGDPSVYSTYAYISRLAKEKGYEMKTVPGVTSFCAAAASLGISLCDGETSLHIIPGSGGLSQEVLTGKGTKVIMKTGKNMENLKKKLKLAGIYEKTLAVERCSMKEEKLYRNMEEVPSEAGYFTILIIKEN